MPRPEQAPQRQPGERDAAHQRRRDREPVEPTGRTGRDDRRRQSVALDQPQTASSTPTTSIAASAPNRDRANRPRRRPSAEVTAMAGSSHHTIGRGRWRPAATGTASSPATSASDRRRHQPRRGRVPTAPAHDTRRPRRARRTRRRATWASATARAATADDRDLDVGAVDLERDHPVEDLIARRLRRPAGRSASSGRDGRATPSDHPTRSASSPAPRRRSTCRAGSSMAPSRLVLICVAGEFWFSSTDPSGWNHRYGSPCSRARRPRCPRRRVSSTNASPPRIATSMVGVRDRSTRPRCGSRSARPGRRAPSSATATTDRDDDPDERPERRWCGRPITASVEGRLM